MASNRVLKQHLETMNRIRLMTLRSLGPDLTTEHLFHQIDGKGSHILWLTAHCAISMDRLINQYVFGSLALSEQWRSTYGGGSTPNPNPAENLSLPEALDGLQKVLAVVTERLNGEDDSILDRALPADSPVIARFQFNSHLIGFAAAHEAYHAGQITMLRKIQGLPAQTPA